MDNYNQNKEHDMQKIVILNCPPRGGKDTIAEGIIKRSPDFGMASFKGKLIEIALMVSGIPLEEWEHRYNSENKELPWSKLGGLSQRNYLIKISEDWVKPVHGKRYFGDRVLEYIQRNSKNNFIIPDGGFEEEVLPLKEGLTPNSLLILQWGREGCTFEYDSRDFITDFPEITRRVRDNNTSIQDQVNAVAIEIDNFFGEHNDV